MTSILEPFASKKTPNETGTISVYANVNSHSEVMGEQDLGSIESPDKLMKLSFQENSAGAYDLVATNEGTSNTLLELSPNGNLSVKNSLILQGSGTPTPITGIKTAIEKDAVTNDQTLPTTKAVIDYIKSRVDTRRLVLVLEDVTRTYKMDFHLYPEKFDDDENKTDALIIYNAAQDETVQFSKFGTRSSNLITQPSGSVLFNRARNNNPEAGYPAGR